MPNNFTIEEIEPQVIGSVQSGRVELDPALEASQTPEIAPEQEEIEEVPEDTTPPMNEELGALKEELNKDINTFLVKIQALKQGENKVVESLKKKHSERDGADKADKETREVADKEIKTKHKEELKAKDQEIKELKKVIAQKEKEVAGLHKQVKEALYQDAEE